MNLAVVIVVAGGYDPSPDHTAKLVDLARLENTTAQH
jgi:hypothetical protein